MTTGWEHFEQAREARTRKEEQESWCRFVEATAPVMRRLASSWLWRVGAVRRWGPDVFEPDDVLFEAYGRLYKSRQLVKDPKRWLCVIIKHIALGIVRGQPDKFEDIAQYGSDAFRGNPEDVARLSTPEPDQLGEAPPNDKAAASLLRQLRRAVRRLPRAPRRVIIGIYFNIPRAELARKLGIEPNTVSVYRSRAIKLLGELLS